MNHASADDALLVTWALEGEDRAFEQLVKRHQTVLRGLLRRLVQDPGLADDLAQRAFVHAWQKLASYRGGSFRSWLCTIGYRMHLRDAARPRLVLEDAAESTAGATGAASRRADLDAALATLTGEQRQAVVLSYVAGMSHGEIAEATGWPLGTAKSHVARGRARLQIALEAYADDTAEP